LEHPVCPIFIGTVSRKNNRDEIVGVFIRFDSKIDSANREGGRERGRVRVEKQAEEGKDPKRRIVLSM
jgi:hypothetical protein